MSTTTPMLPPMPGGAPPAPKKSNVKRNVLIGVALFVALGIGASANGNTSAATQPRTSAPVADTACFDADTATNYIEDATAELQTGVTSLSSYDVDGAADHLQNAADDFGQVAVLAADYPTLAGPAQSASDHMTQAADLLHTGDMETSLTYLNMAKSDMDDVTSAANGLSGVVVPC